MDFLGQRNAFLFANVDGVLFNISFLIAWHGEYRSMHCYCNKRIQDWQHLCETTCVSSACKSYLRHNQFYSFLSVCLSLQFVICRSHYSSRVVAFKWNLLLSSCLVSWTRLGVFTVLNDEDLIWEFERLQICTNDNDCDQETVSLDFPLTSPFLSLPLTESILTINCKLCTIQCMYPSLILLPFQRQGSSLTFLLNFKILF